MKNKNQFLKIFAVAFAISLVTQILSVIILLVRPSAFLDPDYLILNLLTFLLNLTCFTIAPILMFAAFYFIGKNPNLTFELKPIVSALFIGNIASLFIGGILRSVIELSPFGYFLDTLLEIIASYLGILLGIIAYLLPIYLLSALTGISMGHIRRQKVTAIPEPA